MYFVNALIDLHALVHNIKVIKSKVTQSNIVAVVKANAYGHGVIKIAETLDQYVDAFAVARLDEALTIRNYGLKKRIILLEGIVDQSDIPIVQSNDLDVVIHNYKILDFIEQVKLEHPLNCWLKLDTGMHRLGVRPIDAKGLYLKMCNSSNIKSIGLISHLCVADDLDNSDYTVYQIDQFLNFSSEHPKLSTCLANSAGIFSWSKSHTDYVRPGIVMYGVSPYSKYTGSDLGLMPVMTLKSNLIEIKKIFKGEKVGYGNGFVSADDTTIGIVGIGYGDGYPRQIPNGTPVYINGRYVKTAGRVCMDMMFVDLGLNCKDQIGDEVILWGKELPVEIISNCAGTIPYELLTKITNRVRFVYDV